jgi:hypothetical protein
MNRDVFIPDPDLNFLPIPDPGSRGKKNHWIPDPGSATLVTVFIDYSFILKANTTGR